jgi:putative membrane protein (TIGR04086 family)
MPIGKEDMMETVLKNLKGFFFAFILFIVLTLIVSATVKFTPAPEGWSLYYMIGVLCFTCLFLGLYTGNFIKKKGFVYGAIYSIIYLLALSAFYMLAFSSGIETGPALAKYLIPILFGSVGGMIGVNLKN